MEIDLSWAKGRGFEQTARSPALLFLVATGLFRQGMGSATKAVAGPSPRVAGTAVPKIEFRDIARAAGIVAGNVYGGETRKKYILEMTGNGVAIFDFDNDGHRDVLLVNGATRDSNQATHHLSSRQTAQFRECEWKRGEWRLSTD